MKGGEKMEKRMRITQAIKKTLWGVTEAVCLGISAAVVYITPAVLTDQGELDKRVHEECERVHKGEYRKLSSNVGDWALDDYKDVVTSGCEGLYYSVKEATKMYQDAIKNTIK